MTKRVLSMALALVMVLACMAGITVSAETNVPEEFGVFIAYGGDKVGDTSWANSYWGGESVPEGMTVTNGTVKVGETVTVSISFAEPTDKTWVVAPCLTADDLSGVTALDFDIVCKIDGEEVAMDMAADSEGRLWWNEGTGDYSGTQCIRLAGTYNEWGQKYITVPNGITSIEYTITLNSVNAPATSDGPEFGAFIAYGGDKVGDSSWANSYWGGETAPEGVTVTNGTVKAGESVTISITFAEPTGKTWVVAPCLTGNGIGTAVAIDADVVCKIDGQEVEMNMAADSEGRLWWAEGTGDYATEECVRLAGTYNEWGQQFITVPEGITSIEYTITLNEVSFEAVAEGPEFDLFIAYGGDRAESNDWGYEYYGADTEKSAGITAVNDKISVGETVTISLTFENPAVYSWFFSPCLVADDITWIGEVDFDVTCKVNGEEVAINMEADSQGRTWWTEGTGDYTAAQCIRLAGGYNEWGAQFIGQPEGLTTIEYTITLNAVEEAPEPGEEVESKEEYLLVLAYGGDKAAENDWGWSYGGEETAPEGITAVTAKVKSGDTATISLTFATPTVNSWWFAPTLVGTNAGNLISTVDMDIVCKIDGVEVPVNMEADAEGKVFWSEGIGSYKAEDCVRLAGGYNEWATQYIAEPGSFTTIEYTITFNSIKITNPVEEVPTVVEIDKNGTYNAYLMLQTPNWTFRNAHDDAFYGMGGSSWEALGLAWGQYLVHQDHPGETWGVIEDAVIAGNGTYSVKITDFGTVFADDFAASGTDIFNIIAISTDLPAGANVTITDVTLIIDGQVRHTYAEAYINEESTGTLQVLIQNIWNSDVKEISYYPAPSESLEIQFTISGFDYDKTVEEPVDPVDPVDPTDPTDPTDPVEPTNPVEPTEPDPTEPTAPVDPVDEPKNNSTVIISTVIIVVVVLVVAAAVVAVVVLKKKKA